MAHHHASAAHSYQKGSPAHISPANSETEYPTTDSSSNARRDAARNKNKTPCAHCQRNRQKCHGGYPCYYCARHNRVGCAPSAQTTFIQVDPRTKRNPSRPSPSAPSMESQSTTNRAPSGNSGGGAQSTTSYTNHATGGYPALRRPSGLAQRQTFGLMQFINPSGIPDGFVESFIHEHNGTAYYGAWYYDAQGNFLREELCLSRVSRNAPLQMLPPLPAQMPYGIQGHSSHNAHSTTSPGQYRR